MLLLHSTKTLRPSSSSLALARRFNYKKPFNSSSTTHAIQFNYSITFTLIFQPVVKTLMNFAPNIYNYLSKLYFEQHNLFFRKQTINIMVTTRWTILCICIIVLRLYLSKLYIYVMYVHYSRYHYCYSSFNFICWPQENKNH